MLSFLYSIEYVDRCHRNRRYIFEAQFLLSYRIYDLGPFLHAIYCVSSVFSKANKNEDYRKDFAIGVFT